MEKLFGPDTPLMRFLSKLADLVILNILFLLSCLPVITVGAAWTALYYVALKMARNEEGGIIRPFFRSFRQNFRQATCLWLGAAAAAAVLALDYWILAASAFPGASLLKMVLLVTGMVLLMTVQYLFPLLAKFDSGLVQTVKNAFLLAIGHLPKTLIMVFSVIGAGILTFYSGETLSMAIPVWLMLGFAILAFSNSLLLVRIFDGLIPENGAASAGSGRE